MRLNSIHSFGTMPVFVAAGGGSGGGASEIQDEDDNGGGGDDVFTLSDSDLDFSDDGTGPILEGNGDGDGDDVISFDADGFGDKLFEPDDDDDTDNSGGGDDSEAQAAAQAKLTADMKEAIKNITIPEAAIPADFDPADPKQLRDLLTTIQRETVQNSMKIMWQPVAAAFQQTIKNLRTEIQASVEDGVGTNNMKGLLNTAIPNYAKPAVRAIVDPILAQARKKFPGDDRRAVAATRKMLLGLGVKIGVAGEKTNRGSTNRGGRQTAQQRTNDVLDQFMKLPVAVGNGTDARLQNRLQRPKP